MAKGHCPDCEKAGRKSLREIVTSDVPVGRTGTAMRWILEHHPDGEGQLCPGSGKLI